MALFQVPPPTRYDLRFSIAGIPVRVHPLFWLITFLFGFSLNNLLYTFLWMFVVFISILIHELGHAFAFRRYGLRSSIVLHYMGGLTIPESVSWGSGWANIALTPREEIFISLAGPFSGFLFAALIVGGVIASGGSIAVNWLLGFIPLPTLGSLPFGGLFLSALIVLLLSVNIFWGLINLVPVYPLDGGNVARYALLQYDPRDGIRKSLWLSVIAGGIVAVLGLVSFGSIYMALLFGFLAFQSYQSLQNRFGGGF
ncbi:MAG TPA: site-2 protease family protein [Anaerolineales bacterium]|nr:site-2 protease family protein [Anaerolineales bacterium]